jgi:hypothetical protein
MASSGMLRRVALVRTDVSEEFNASFIRLTRMGELGTTLAVTGNRRFPRSVRRLLVTASVVPSSPILVSLMVEAISSSETLVLVRATRRNIPEDAILHSHRREDLNSYLLDHVFQRSNSHTPQHTLTSTVLGHCLVLRVSPIVCNRHTINCPCRSGGTVFCHVPVDKGHP